MIAFGEVIEGEALEVEIINWEKYNPRKDIKHPRWFAFDNRMLESAQFFHFTADELKAWVYLLSQASQKSNSKIELFFEHAERVCGIKRKSFEAALEKLEKIQVVHVSVRDPYASVQNPTATLHYTTLQTNKHNTAAYTSDFEIFYLGYPRKMKRGEALKAYLRERKSGANAEDLLLAREKFLSYHKAKCTEEDFIPYPATMLSGWRDWLDPVTGSSEIKTKAEQDWDAYLELERKAKEGLA